jgi:hypothetical protein
MTEFLHYTRNPDLKIDPDWKYRHSDKPGGLWLSVGTSWDDWCRHVFSEEKDLMRLACAYSVDLDTSGFLEVTGGLSARQLGWDFPARAILPDEWDPRYAMVDWGAIAKCYTGILFYPYPVSVFSFESAPLWYYAIDCDSAVVFDLAAIRSVTRKEAS